jgi:uncharacterized phage infection (PIP) family protein YhgE
MCMGGGGAAKRVAGEQARADAERANQIQQGQARINQNFAGFDDNFFQGRQQAFIDNAMPQLDQQFQDARRNLIYRLADTGTIRSSVAGTRLGDLERQYSERKLQLADEARGFATQNRADLEGVRGNLMSSLVASGDAALAGQQAAQQAQVLAAQPTFSPLAQVFQNVGSGIGTSVAARDAGAIRDRYTPLYQKTGSGSGRVVN